MGPNATWLIGRGAHMHRAVVEPAVRSADLDATPKSQ